MALNAPIQGSAADIIKTAMLRVDAALARASAGSRLLLQVHDELVLEIAPGEHSEVEALRARRDFLAGDVEELERFLAAQRMRLGDVAERLMGFVAAPIEGLGFGGRPVLSGAEPAREMSTGSSVDDIIDVAEDAVEQLVLTETADPTPPSGPGLRFRDGV
jgi:hypothetical protein